MAKKKPARPPAKRTPSKPPKARRGGGEAGDDGASPDMDSDEENFSALSSQGSLIRRLGEISKLDLSSAKEQLEALICNGACEGWLFETPSSIESLMFHLMLGLNEAANEKGNIQIPNIRDSRQAQECLVEIALFFFHAKPPKEYASDWVIDCFDLPHFKEMWARRIWRAKPPNIQKLDFVLTCMKEFDERLSILIDSLMEFDRRKRKWNYFPLSNALAEIHKLRESEAPLADAIETVLNQIHADLPNGGVAFERYLSRSPQEFIRLVLPWIEARWRALSLNERKKICGSKAKGQQGWGKVDAHMAQAARIVVLCALAFEEPIFGLTLERVREFVKA